MATGAISVTSYPAINGAAAVVKEMYGVLSQVDPFLVEALENPRHRLTVLRMELDIQRFMQNPDQNQFEFPPLPTSYLRCAGHRVAQHYGLQTLALDSIGADGFSSRVTASKTVDSKFPLVRLSELPLKQHENETDEKVKIVIRPRASRDSLSELTGPGTKASPLRSVEERKEDYNKARARIFSGSNSPEMDNSSSVPSPDDCWDEQEFYRALEESQRAGLKDGASRVAIFRDREKDRSDPDYDRSYKRYVREVGPSQNFCLGGGNVFRPPSLQYDVGFHHQLGPLPPRILGPVSQRPSNLVMNPYCAYGSNQTSKDAVFVQWPSHPVMYANSYEHYGHAVFQPPFYQHPLSFEHSGNC